MNVIDRSARLREKFGIALLAIGLAAFVEVYDRYDSLPNYLRIAVFVPFAFAFPMVTVEADRSRWSTLSPVQKGHSVVWLFAPFVVVGGSLAWYLFDPTATG